MVAALAFSPPAMAWQQTITATSPGLAPALVVLSQPLFRNCDVGLILTFGPGTTANASVEVTGDNPCSTTNDPTLTCAPGIASIGFVTHWNNHDTLVSQTGSANGNLQFPVTAVTLLINNINQGGVVALSVVECDSK